jgi:ATP-dependent Lhr-like helicase
MRDVLLHEGAEDVWLAPHAALELKELRVSYSDVLDGGNAPLEDETDGMTWHTFAGGAVNRLLAAGLELKCGKRWVAGNLSLRCKDVSMTAARDAVRDLPTLDWEHVAASAARAMARGMVSKFQPCLPAAAEDRLLAERLLDLTGTLRLLGTVTIAGVRATSRPVGIRLLDPEMNGALALDLPAPLQPTKVATPKNEIQWIDTPAALRSVVVELGREDVVGLDVETGLDFGTLCLIQISTPTRTYLIDPFAVGDLAPLDLVMSVPRPQKVIHNSKFERRVLAASGIGLDGVFDTLEVSRRVRGKDVMGGHGLAMVPISPALVEAPCRN